jgi:hypothetical protein
MMTGNSGPNSLILQCQKTVWNQRLIVVNLIWLTLKIDFDLSLFEGELDSKIETRCTSLIQGNAFFALGGILKPGWPVAEIA